MISPIMASQKIRSGLLGILLWCVIWVWPWGKLIVPDGNDLMMFGVQMIKLGLAICVFIVPGAVLYALLRPVDASHHDPWWTLVVGLALSVSLVCFLGLVGRVLGWPYSYVKFGFAGFGLVGLIIHTVWSGERILVWGYTVNKMQGLLGNIPLLSALIFGEALTFNGYQFFIDDTAYAAYATSWRESTQLGFGNIVHYVGGIENARFWLAMFPMTQSVLSDLSGVPVLLLFSNYLELFLVPIAILVTYWLARYLGLARLPAGVAVLIQIVFYAMMIDDSWPVGFWFYNNLAEDKVFAVFILAPVFFFLAFEYLRSLNGRLFLLVFICGLGLMLTHPVILFLVCVLVLGILGISMMLAGVSWQAAFHLTFIVFLIVSPNIIIRVFDRYIDAGPFDAKSASATFQIEKYANIVAGGYYGLNIDTLKLFDIEANSSLYDMFQVVRFLPVAVLLIALILSLSRIRDGLLYWYVGITTLLVFLAAIPYAGWMIGYFISARMISRVSWFMPLGLAGALIIERYIPMRPAMHDQPNAAVKGVMAGLVLALIMFLSFSIYQVPSYFMTQAHNSQLAQLGAFIDRQADDVVTVVALDYSDTQLLPAVSARANLLSFREEVEYNGFNNSLPIAEVRARIAENKLITSLEAGERQGKRCELLMKYKVEYVIAPARVADQYAQSVSACGIQTQKAKSTKDLILLKLVR
jgi:hypothetical protein